MYIRKVFLGLIVSFFVIFGLVYAGGSMFISPSTGTFAMRCVYPISFFVNVGGIESKAIDMRIIYDNMVMQFTGDGNNQVGYGTSLVRTGTTTVDTYLPWRSYSIGSKYWLFNRSDLITPLSGFNNQLYYTWYFQTIANVLTGYLDFYYVEGWNGDDSNIQSGVINNFVDVLDTINSGYYNFVARPCILDTDMPLFTGYNSGGVQSYLSGITFTIYDFTGKHIIGYNSTYHYRFSSDPADHTNLANYVHVGTDVSEKDIDNQYGVNSGTIIVNLSGLSFGDDVFTGEMGSIYPAGTLIFTSFTLLTWSNNNFFTCTPISTSVNMGYALTWNRLPRGYDCLLTSGLLISGVNLDSNQTILITITGADNPNYLGQTHTGVLSFSITINGIDNTPPYIVSGAYFWTGALNGFATTGAGPSFSLSQIDDWEYWTKDDVYIYLTGNEDIVITSVVGFSGSDLNVYVSGGNGYSGINQTLIFTGNMSGFIVFRDIPTLGRNPNYGQTYQTGNTRYVYDFTIDVFWIDRITTEVTGYLIYTGENGQLHHATLILSGFATGNVNSIKDDEFYVYAYSGVDGASNTPDVSYISGYSSTGYSLFHSGIVFNDNWTGYILYRDRANNTGMFYVNVTGINKSYQFTLIAIPGDRNYSQGAYSGVIARFVIVSGYQSSNYLYRTGDVIFSGLIKTDGQTSDYSFNYGLPLGTGYTVIVESQNHLSVLATGLEITGSRVFNFSQTGDLIASSVLGPERMIAGDFITFSDSITTGSYKDGQINPSDIGAWLAWYTRDINFYSGGFHVRTGSPANLIPSNAPLSLKRSYAQYHPGELDGDGIVTSSDLVIIVNNMDEPSHIRIRNGGAFFDEFN